MATLTVGILSPGQMGSGIGAVLHHHGARIITSLKDRGPGTKERAERAGFEAVDDDDELVSQADIILSVLAPALAVEIAERVAEAVRATGANLLYIDCNAISPVRARMVEATVTKAGAGVHFADVGIIGGPPKVGGESPRFYASGPEAGEFAELGEYGLEVRQLGGETGQASGFKMCYGALTKGLTALATSVLVASRKLGLEDPLTAEFEDSQSTLFGIIQRQIPTMPPKAGRWVGEMEEIAATLESAGLPGDFHQGAARLYDWIYHTMTISEDHGVPVQQPLAEIISTLAENAHEQG